MKNQYENDDHALRGLRDAYVSQPVQPPREEWVQSVMGRVRQEPQPARMVLSMLEVLAWRTGWVAAVAASLFALLSLTAMPSRERLAWDLYQGGAMAQLSVRMGE